MWYFCVWLNSNKYESIKKKYVVFYGCMEALQSTDITDLLLIKVNLLEIHCSVHFYSIGPIV